jgi:hypothetical protein
MCKFENPRFNLISVSHKRTCKNEGIMKKASRSLKSTTSRWLFTCMYQRINNHAIKVLVQQNFTWTLRLYHSSMKDTQPYMNKLLVVWCLGGTKHLTNVFKKFNAWNFMKIEVVRGCFKSVGWMKKSIQICQVQNFLKLRVVGVCCLNTDGTILKATCSFAWHYFFLNFVFMFDRWNLNFWEFDKRANGFSKKLAIFLKILIYVETTHVLQYSFYFVSKIRLWIPKSPQWLENCKSNNRI